ncbi:hypothetical protein L208DRAFT_675287 [Tricholoma matsutake]|nr:hypothetical protein L208DRAFT_675287 [Tricholoma matsutake 945]
MPRAWTVKEVCDLVKVKLGKQACWLQIKIALALYAKKDVVRVDIHCHTSQFTRKTECQSTGQSQVECNCC